MTPSRQAGRVPTPRIAPLPSPVYTIVLWPKERAALHARIVKRLDAMFAQGFIEEVKALRERGDLTPDLPSMRAIGYRQVWDYLEGRLSQAELYEKTQIATRQFAKRQLTWLRRWPDAHRFDVTFDRIDECDHLLSQVIVGLDEAL